jgi:parallel beta-helix repeat protein
MLENNLSRYGTIARDISFDKLNPVGRIFFAVNPQACHIRSYLMPKVGGVQVDTTRPPATWYAEVQNEFPPDRNGVVRFHSTIQAAVDATAVYDSISEPIGGRGDVVLVGPGKWKENVNILEKVGLKIFGPGGRDYDGSYLGQMRSSDASTLYPIGALGLGGASGCTFSVLSKGVEIAGFFFDSDGGHAGIYVGGGLYSTVNNAAGYDDESAAGCYIHNNYFNNGYYGIVLDGCRNGVKISNNIFYGHTRASIAMWPGNASCENTIIKDNDFCAGNAGYGIWIYGEANACLSTLIAGNTFRDGYGKVFAAAIKNMNATGGGVVGVCNNFFACDVKMILSTGDYTSGNYYGWAGSATEDNNYFVEELTGGV